MKPISPTEISRYLTSIIMAGRLDVELVIDIHWYYLRVSGFRLIQFGDTSQRDASLGKWISAHAMNAVVSEAEKLIPLIHDGTMKLARFDNIAAKHGGSAKIAVYCMDRDRSVETALKALGWNIRWKYNHQTHS